MNQEQLVDKFDSTAVADSAIGHFMYGSLTLINQERDKLYPVVIMAVPISVSKPYKYQSNEPKWEDFEIMFHVFKLWTETIKLTTSRRQIYQQIEDIGEDYLDTILAAGSNEYFLIGDQAVAKDRGEFHQHGVDPVIGVSFKFTLRVHDCRS